MPCLALICITKGPELRITSKIRSFGLLFINQHEKNNLNWIKGNRQMLGYIYRDDFGLLFSSDCNAFTSIKKLADHFLFHILWSLELKKNKDLIQLVRPKQQKPVLAREDQIEASPKGAIFNKHVLSCIKLCMHVNRPVHTPLPWPLSEQCNVQWVRFYKTGKIIK